MSVIAQLVVADPSEAETVLKSDDPANSWPGFGYKGLDNVRPISLWSLIESTSPDDRFQDRLETVRVIRDQSEQRSVDICGRSPADDELIQTRSVHRAPGEFNV